VVVRVDRVIPAVLADVVRKAPLCPEKVEFAWRSAVGPVIQRATTVRLDAQGVLHVTAADPNWGREIKRSSKLILGRLAPMLGPGIVKKIRV
jgi:predicted nucleic acid-binding Zn ribbon protein